MTEADKQFRQAVQYFSAPGFKRLIAAMAERYRRLGRIGGTVKLGQLSHAEREALSGVLGRDLLTKEVLTMQVKEFQEALSKTRFAGLDLVELLQGVTKQPLRTVAAEMQAFKESKICFFAELMQQYPHPRCREWLAEVAHKPATARSIHTAYRKDSTQLRTDLSDVLKAISHLPVDDGSVKRLPVWATEITGDPHAFDYQSVRGRYLAHALNFFRANVDDETDGEEAAEAQASLLDSFGIVKDDIRNFVTCCGLLAEDGEGPLKSWQAALSESTVLNVPVRELTKLHRVAVAGTRNQVFVVENPGVFSDLLDNLPGPVPPLVCTHGQFKLASYLLLDKLAASGATIWYSGDHDPEGLLMAQRLCDRYPGQAKPWCFGGEDYLTAVSDVTIPQRRLKQLERVSSVELLTLRDEMQKVQKAGYQERLLPRLLHDIKIS